MATMRAWRVSAGATAGDTGMAATRTSPAIETATYSHALQETLHAMGRAVLERHPDVVEIRFSAPNRHHFLVDFSAFPDVENHGEVFFAADRPYGLIEAVVLRDDVPAAPEAWVATPGFC